MSATDNEAGQPAAPDDQPLMLIHAPRIASGAEGWLWITEGFRYFRQAPGDWLALCVVGALLMLAINIIPFGSLLNGFLSQVWIAGVMLGCKAQQDGRKLEIKYLFAGFGPKTGKLVLSSLAILATEIVLGMLFLGSILIPLFLQEGLNLGAFDTLINDSTAVFMLAIKLLVLMALLLPVVAAGWFAPLLIVFGDLPVQEALLMSMKGCLINVWSFLVYGLAGLVLLIIAVIPLGLGLLVLVPVLYVSLYVSFRAIYVD